MNIRFLRPRPNAQRTLPFALLVIAACSLACVPAPPETLAAAGGDHGDEPHGPEPVQITHFSDKLCLFLEYPRLYPGIDARFLAHFTVLEDGSALESGSVTVELGVDGVTHQVLTAGDASQPGIFVPEWSPTEPGSYEARLIVESPVSRETIPLPNVIVHRDLAAADEAAHEEAHAGPGTPANAVPFLMEQQWSVGLQTAEIERRILKSELRVNGEVALPSEMLAAVNAPLPGTLLPPSSGASLSLGDHVEAGQELGRIQPPVSFADRAQALSNRMAKDSMGMEIAIRESDVISAQALSQAEIEAGETRLQFAAKAHDRISKLRNQDLGTIEQLENAERELELAKAHLAGLLKKQVVYAETGERLQTLSEGLEALELDGPLNSAPSLPLRAPISGGIHHVFHIPGEVVDESSAVWEIVSHDRVRILAHVSEFDFPRLGKSPRARAQFEDDAASSFDLGAPLPRHLSEIDRDTRTLALMYELEHPTVELVSGMGADVFIELGSAINAAAIPIEAIVKEDGRPIAFVLVNGETFQKRDLKLGLHSGPYVEILEGLRSGERVVTNGAYLLKLASADPAEFGHGHAH